MNLPLLFVVIFGMLAMIPCALADEIPAYANVIVPPNTTIPTDKSGNTIPPELDKTTYFHYNVTNGYAEPRDFEIRQHVFSDDTNEMLVNKTDSVHIEPGGWAAVVWQFTPKTAGNYYASASVSGLPPIDTSYHFIIKDPAEKYHAAAILIVNDSANDSCMEGCFVPSFLSVKPHTVVTWANNSTYLHKMATGTLEHDSTGILAHFDRVFQTGMLGKNETFSFLFVKPGRYDYFGYGPSMMNGTIQVEDDSDVIKAQCLDGTQFLRQGTVDMIQLGDDGKFQVGKKTKLVASILNKDGKQKTMGLRLQILSLHPEIKVDKTKQVVFGSCPSRALIEWEFTPKVPGKHWITLKEDTFGGSGYSTNIDVSDPSGKTIRGYILSPLKQFESGVAPEKTICQVPLQLIIREDGHPACVKPTSIHRLWLSSWAKKSTDIYTEYSTNEILEKFHSKIISGGAALQIAQDYIKKNNLVLNVDTHSPDFQITTSLVYSNIATGSLGMLDVDPETGLPTGVMGPFAEKYYRNPQWWSELQKDYLGMKSNRVEDGQVIWRVAWRDCPNCIAQYQKFFIDAINGTILGSPDRR